MSATNDRLTVGQQRILINEVSDLLRKQYVRPNVAEAMAAFLQDREKASAYRTAAVRAEFAKLLTSDLQRVSHDQHLLVSFDPDTASSLSTPASAAGPRASSFVDPVLVGAHYYIREAARLDGDIGYLDIHGFAPLAQARDTIAQSMTWLAGTSAVIIDLRKNFGGVADTVNFIASYFFGPRPVELLHFYNRQSGETRIERTLGDLPGARIPNADVFLLTSGKTASGGEALAFIMQHFRNGTVVGERTTGAGYSGHDEPLSFGFVIHVSLSRPFDPRDDSGWEGTGVQPDVPIRADKALDMAYSIALERLIGRTTDKAQLQHLHWAKGAADARLHPTVISTAAVEQYLGTYGDRSITAIDGDLYYQKVGRPRMRILPMAADLFELEWEDITRVSFIRDATRHVTGLRLLYDDGGSLDLPKTIERPGQR